MKYEIGRNAKAHRQYGSYDLLEIPKSDINVPKSDFRISRSAHPQVMV